MPNYDFLLEHRLKELNSEFAYRHTCCMSLFEQMLKKFLAVFPTFTDHTLLHTLSVTNISNQLLRENVRKSLVPVIAAVKEDIRKELGIEAVMFYDNDIYGSGASITPVLDKDGMFREAQAMYNRMNPEIGHFMAERNWKKFTRRSARTAAVN